MKTLALETSLSGGSIALLDAGQLVCECEFPRHCRTTQSFAVIMKQALAKAKWSPQDVRLVAISGGPGSFTGLRIGATAAKSLAYVVGADVLAVNTLEVIASQVSPTDNTLTTVIDAQRQQLFSASFRFDQGNLRLLHPTEIISREQWLSSRQDGEVVSGVGLRDLVDRLPSEVEVVDESLWYPRASTLGILADTRYASGQRDDVWKLTPRYYRKSAAEEKAEQKRRDA